MRIEGQKEEGEKKRKEKTETNYLDTPSILLRKKDLKRPNKSYTTLNSESAISADPTPCTPINAMNIMMVIVIVRNVRFMAVPEIHHLGPAFGR